MYFNKVLNHNYFAEATGDNCTGAIIFLYMHTSVCKTKNSFSMIFTIIKIPLHGNNEQLIVLNYYTKLHGNYFSIRL